MIYTEVTRRAMRLAYRAHHGQLDKGGEPYIFHPMHVAEQMHTPEETAVALLHDVVEDGGATLEALRAEGFSEEIVEAVRVITRPKQMRYADYILEVGKNPIARQVKIADLRHNMDLSRIGMTEESATEAARARIAKYRAALDELEFQARRMRIRHASLEDLAAIAKVEAECFPTAEAATREDFSARLRAYPDRFWLLFDGDALVSFVNGMTTDEPDLRDEMYADASLHSTGGAWQMIFGVNTIPGYRRQGCAARLLREAIRQSREEGRAGLVLTCKERLLPYYGSFGFVSEGVSASVHGNVQWYQMRLRF